MAGNVARSPGVHRLGFGVTGPLAQTWFPEREAVALIVQAYAAGIRHFDSAGFYGGGEGERRLATALAGAEDVFISTKTGTRARRFRAKAKDFSETAIRADLAASLERLRLDKVDCFYLHGPDPWVVRHTAPLFQSLKTDGLIARSGVCGDGAAIEETAARRDGDAVMARYNLFDMRHGPAFQMARAAGLRTTAIAPLAQALYRPDFFRPRGLADVWAIARAGLRNRPALLAQRREAGRRLNALPGWAASEAMLAYVFANPDIDLVLTSTTKADHLDQLIRACKRPLDQETLDRLRVIPAQGRQPEITNPKAGLDPPRGDG